MVTTHTRQCRVGSGFGPWSLGYFLWSLPAPSVVTFPWTPWGAWVWTVVMAQIA